ncbi:hypothetical protein DICVIV_03100 [Dictyocaulus viviparus]|uniref:Uncharacterized protein n=1 Tax=Dictyocaulus viviparus TaxID=29172 RepID=A0A0D8Y1P3_DICVI|nr:hypothetical protein DICVIV_03100 [Dictyocaulus viviparus]
MLSYALFMSAVFLSECESTSLIFRRLTLAVSLHLVQSACAENPNLAFCDSHLLENFTPPPTQSTVTSEPLKTSDAKNANRSNEETQFMAWLIDQNDEALNMEIDESERPQKHSNGKKYCSKYKDNFGMYCKKSNIESLEQVLQKFCTIYAHQCENHSDFPTPGPLLPSSESTTQDSDEDSTGYCHKFLAHFQKLCSINQQYDSKKTNEFCSTYRDRCQSSTLNDLVKDNEQIDDLPDSLEIDTTFQPRKEENKKPESDISTYCEKYWENFNFYCAGQSTSGHEKFCESFRRNCPQKIGS